MKKCTICQIEKELTEFNKHKNKKDGLQTVCRECNKKGSEEYYERNKEKHKEDVKKYKNKSYVKNRRKKICKACYKDVSIKYFGDDGLKTICNDCKKKKAQIKDNKIRNNKRELIKSYKKECLICGENDTDILQFHHIKDKHFSIGTSISISIPTEIIIQEISKCIILCASCHIKYHKKRFSLLSDKPNGVVSI